MLRKLLTVVLPFLLPFLIYWIYLLLQKRRAKRAGEAPPTGWATAPWGIILVAAVALTIAALVTYRFTIEEQWRPMQPPTVTGEPGSPAAGEGIRVPDATREGATQEGATRED
jgi:hypothetical protein